MDLFQAHNLMSHLFGCQITVLKLETCCSHNPYIIWSEFPPLCDKETFFYPVYAFREHLK